MRSRKRDANIASDFTKSLDDSNVTQNEVKQKPPTKGQIKGFAQIKKKFEANFSSQPYLYRFSERDYKRLGSRYLSTIPSPINILDRETVLRLVGPVTLDTNSLKLILKAINSLRKLELIRVTGLQHLDEIVQKTEKVFDYYHIKKHKNQPLPAQPDFIINFSIRIPEIQNKLKEFDSLLKKYEDSRIHLFEVIHQIAKKRKKFTGTTSMEVHDAIRGFQWLNALLYEYFFCVHNIQLFKYPPPLPKPEPPRRLNKPESLTNISKKSSGNLLQRDPTRQNLSKGSIPSPARSLPPPVSEEGFIGPLGIPVKYANVTVSIGKLIKFVTKWTYKGSEIPPRTRDGQPTFKPDRPAAHLSGLMFGGASSIEEIKPNMLNWFAGFLAEFNISHNKRIIVAKEAKSRPKTSKPGETVHRAKKTKRISVTNINIHTPSQKS